LYNRSVGPTHRRRSGSTAGAGTGPDPGPVPFSASSLPCHMGKIRGVAHPLPPLLSGHLPIQACRLGRPTAAARRLGGRGEVANALPAADELVQPPVPPAPRHGRGEREGGEEEPGGRWPGGTEPQSGGDGWAQTQKEITSLETCSMGAVGPGHWDRAPFKLRFQGVRPTTGGLPATQMRGYPQPRERGARVAQDPGK